MDQTSRAILAAIERDPTDPVPYADLLVWLRSLAAEGHRDTEANAAARAIAGRALATMAFPTPRAAEAVGESLRALLDLDAPVDLDCFMQAMEFDRDPESRLWLPRRHRLGKLCEDLQWLETDHDAEFLSVSMPPRTGKSSICGMFMTWHMGRNPSTSNLVTAHSDPLTRHFYDQALLYITSTEYRFHEIFPECPLVDRSAEYQSLDLQSKSAYPTLVCRSIGGTLTGAVEVGEGGILCADDLVRDLEESRSPRRLESKWDAYVNQAYDRRKSGSKQLMIGTRWAVEDPIGRMMRLREGEKGVRVLTVPALDPETGESNFKYLYGVGFDTGYYLDMKRTTDPVTWRAKYEGRPTVAEGLLFPEDRVQRYLTLPEGRPQRVITAVDTKDRGVDYCAAPIAATWGDGLWYIIDAMCDKSAPTVVRRRCADIIAANNCDTAVFESNNTGASFADDVNQMLFDKGVLCAVTKRYTGTNKETRILSASGWVLEHCIFRDPSLYSPQGDYGLFMSQLMGYTLEGKNLHDDAPDSMAMLADVISKRKKAKVTAVRRPL